MAAEQNIGSAKGDYFMILIVSLLFVVFLACILGSDDLDVVLTHQTTYALVSDLQSQLP